MSPPLIYGTVSKMDYRALGKQVKDLREGLNLSLEQLAGNSKVAKNTINQIELGKGNPTVGTLESLARHLGVNITAFFDKLPAQYLGAKGAKSGVDQLNKGKRNAAAAEVAHVRPARHLPKAKPAPDVAAGVSLLSLYQGLKSPRREIAAVMIFDDPAYLADYPELARAVEALLKG